jgi:hypothetical protein
MTAGLAPAERCVALLAAARDGRLIPRHSFWQLASLRKARTRGQPLLLIAQEDVLVFRRSAIHTSSGAFAYPRTASGPNHTCWRRSTAGSAITPRITVHYGRSGVQQPVAATPAQTDGHNEQGKR